MLVIISGCDGWFALRANLNISLDSLALIIGKFKIGIGGVLAYLALVGRLRL